MKTLQILKDTDIRIRESLDAVRILYKAFDGLDHEESWALYMNNTGKPIAAEMITCGTLTSTLMDRRRIVKKALLCDATAVILYHNHPSGEPLPSSQDISQTDELKKACALFDISLLDHIIIGDRCYFSFADNSKHAIGKR